MLGAAITAVTSLIGGNKEEAANADALANSTDAMQQAYDAIQQFYELGNQYTDPYSQAGSEAAKLYGSQALFGDLSEGDQYTLDQNIKKLRMMQAASGNRQSGMAARSLSDLLAQAYTDKYNTDYGTLINQLNYGSGAAQTAAQAANTAGSNIASIYTGGSDLANAYTQAGGSAEADRWQTIGTLAGGFASSGSDTTKKKTPTTDYLDYQGSSAYA